MKRVGNFRSTVQRIFPVFNLFLIIYALLTITISADGVPFSQDRNPNLRFISPKITDTYSYSPEFKTSGMSPQELDSAINSIIQKNYLPGVAVAVIKGDKVIYSKGYGYARIETGQKTTDTTSYMLASVSKTFTGMALMQLWEAGAFDLDDDVNDYLPFSVRNPNYPHLPITFRMILTHTSSLRDNWDVMYSTYHPGDSPIPLPYYVENYFVAGGEFYNENKNFYQWSPGVAYTYCNHGLVLAGYLVEAVSGIDLNQWCRDSIFTPLDMRQTAWFFSELNSNNIAMPYNLNMYQLESIGHFGYADWPAGQLRSSALDLAKHLRLFMNYGQVDGVRLLDSTTVAEITTIQYPNIYTHLGLVWFNFDYWGCSTWMHDGGDQGVATYISFCNEYKTAVVVLTNISNHSAVSSIKQLLFQFSEQGIHL
ncbi:MAG: serine hydrolase, partial [Candidatus Zixiibacteriota bacterium]